MSTPQIFKEEDGVDGHELGQNLIIRGQDQEWVIKLGKFHCVEPKVIPCFRHGKL
jgi:hypothetical protein